MDKFRSFAQTLDTFGIELSIRNTLNLFDAMEDLFSPTPALPNEAALIELRAKLTGDSVHEQLVRLAVANNEILDFVYQGKKIQAIKVLRENTKCDLRDCKDAIEDHRVAEAADENCYPF